MDELERESLKPKNEIKTYKVVLEGKVENGTLYVDNCMAFVHTVPVAGHLTLPEKNEYHKKFTPTIIEEDDIPL